MAQEDTIRLTYAELAKARGITIDSARRMTVRHRWPKRVGNDGLTRIDVPTDALTGASTDSPTGDTTDAPTDAGRAVEAPPMDDATIAAIAAAVAAATDARTDIMLAAATGDTRHLIAAVEAAMAQQAIDHRAVIATLQEAITSLRVELYAERDRAIAAEQRVREMEVRAARRWWRRHKP